MKTDERHELEQNDLISGLSRAINWIRPNLAYVGIGLLVLVVVGAWALYERGAQSQEVSAAWREFLDADNPEQFEVLINRYPGSPAIPYAKLRIADYRFEQGKQRLVTDRNDALLKLDDSIKIYQDLAADSAIPTDVREQAEMGLALATESKGALQKAKAEYQHIADAYAGTVEALIAQAHIKELDTPQVDKFYAQLREYKPPQLSTELPGKDKLDDLDVPPIPKSKGADAKPFGKSAGLDLEKVDVPAPPKSKTIDKKVEPPVSKPAEKKAEPPAAKAATPPADAKEKSAADAKTKPADVKRQ